MQQNYPQQNALSTVLNNAFNYWKATLPYQVMMSLMVFCILFAVYIFFGNYYEVLPKMMTLIDENKTDIQGLQKGIQALAQDPNYVSFMYVILATKVFLFPLEVGFFKIYRKLDLKEKTTLSDLFSGYSGINFFIYISYFFFWQFVFTYTASTIILGILWIITTFLVTPLMFFANKTLFNAILINFKALKTHFPIVFIGFIVALIFKYAGFMVFFIGCLFTYPFMTAMIYAIYQQVFSEQSES